MINLIGSLTANNPKRLKRQATYDISDREEYQDSDGNSYMLAASSSNVLTKKKVDNQLVCSKPGMYADVNNNCEVFHFCVETGRPDGSGYDLRQYSFFCGQGTIFDQYTLTCQVPEKAIPCEYATVFYDINKRTEEGKKEVFLHREDDGDLVKPYYEESRTRRSKSPKISRSKQVNNFDEDEEYITS